MPVLKRTKLQLALAGLLSNAKRWVYRFDGIDDFISIPVLNIAPGDRVVITFEAPSQYDSYRFVSATSNSSHVYVSGSNGYFRVQRGTLKLDGIDVPDNTVIIPTDSVTHQIEWMASESTNIGFLCGTQHSMEMNFVIYSVEVFAADGNRLYMINDGWLESGQVVDSIGGQHGTANNFNQERWELVDV